MTPSLSRPARVYHQLRHIRSLKPCNVGLGSLGAVNRLPVTRNLSWQKNTSQITLCTSVGVEFRITKPDSEP